MTKQDIINNNKLIADFMGYHYVTGEGWLLKKYDKLDNIPKIIIMQFSKYTLGRHHGDLRFYNDWNWLMDVIVSIEELGYSVGLGTDYISVWFHTDKVMERFMQPHGKRKTTYLAIIDFIN